jgi:hypothetical protein
MPFTFGTSAAAMARSLPVAAGALRREGNPGGHPLSRSGSAPPSSRP